MSAPTLRRAIREYLTALDAGGVPPNTIANYQSVLRRLSRAFPGRQYRGMTERDLSAFLYGPGGILVGKAPGTGTVYRSALQGFFDYGRSMGWGKRIDRVPQPVIRQRGPRRMDLPTRLTGAQLRLLIDCADEPMLRGMLAVAMNTALRISDVVKIQARHVAFQTGEIAVWNQKTRKYDELPMTLDAESELRKYLSWWSAETGASLSDGEAFLFPGWRWNGPTRELSTGCHITYGWAYTHLTDLYAECGIQVERREAWHVIRRSVARIYFDSLRGEVSFDHALRQTASLLGHSSASTTEKYLGFQSEREARNESLRGKRLIPGLGGEVTPLTRRTSCSR